MPVLGKDVGEKAAGFQALRGNLGAPAYSFQEDPDTGFILVATGIGVVVNGVLVGVLPDDLGATTTPGGATTQVQFNDAGAFGGDAGLTFNKTTDVLTLAGGLVSPSVGPAAAQQHTLPAVASDTVVLLAATQTLTNKTLTAAVLGGTTNVSGGQLQFPAIQVPSAGANTLDDYEEGSFTPTVEGTTAAGVGTYTVQVARYIKIGRVVQFQLRLWWTAHTGTGNIRIAGLPFASANIGDYYASLNIRHENLALTANNWLQCHVGPNGTTIALEQVPTGGGAAANVPMDTAADLILTGTYQSEA